jgi:hypothetical protein
VDRFPDFEFEWNSRTININELPNCLAQAYQSDIANCAVCLA